MLSAVRHTSSRHLQIYILVYINSPPWPPYTLRGFDFDRPLLLSRMLENPAGASFPAIQCFARGLLHALQTHLELAIVRPSEAYTCCKVGTRCIAVSSWQATGDCCQALPTHMGVRVVSRPISLSQGACASPLRCAQINVLDHGS